MVKKNQKLPYTQASKRARKMIDDNKEISDVLQDTNLTHKNVLKIKNEDVDI